MWVRILLTKSESKRMAKAILFTFQVQNFKLTHYPIVPIVAAVVAIVAVVITVSLVALVSATPPLFSSAVILQPFALLPLVLARCSIVAVVVTLLPLMLLERLFFSLLMPLLGALLLFLMIAVAFVGMAALAVGRSARPEREDGAERTQSKKISSYSHVMPPHFIWRTT